MKKLAVLEKVLDSGIVAIVRTDHADKAKKIVGAISEGGIKIIEVTMSVPGAIDVIKELSGFCAQEAITLASVRCWIRKRPAPRFWRERNMWSRLA